MMFGVLVHFLVIFVVCIRCDDDSDSTLTTLNYDKEFNLECPEIIEALDEQNIYWYKGGKKVEDIKHIWISTKDSKSIMTIRYPKSGDEGNYTCKRVNLNDGSVLGEKKFNVVGKAYVKVKSDIAVIEGETLRVECIAIGTLPINIYWIVGDKTYTTSKDRVELSTKEGQPAENNVLKLESVNLSDRGDIYCLGLNKGVSEENKPNEAKVYVRVKDKYAAVWPFLGIVLETGVLIIVIFVCEKFYKKDPASSDDEEESDKVLG